MADEHLKMCADEHPSITFNPDFHEGRCPLCRCHDLLDELQLQLQLVSQERDRLIFPTVVSSTGVKIDGLGIVHPEHWKHFEGRQSPLNIAGNAKEKGISVDDLRDEIEQQYQELCGKAQLGGAATLDDLADVASNIAKMMQVVDDLATAVIRMQYAPDRERPQAGTEE